MLLALLVIALAAGLMWLDIRYAPQIEARRLLADIDRGAAPTVLDVRSDWEYRQGHVPGALHAPFWSLSALLALPAPKQQPMVIYCELGPRASWAKWVLRLRGYQQVAFLTGQMYGWRQQGLRMEITKESQR